MNSFANEELKTIVTALIFISMKEEVNAIYQLTMLIKQKITDMLCSDDEVKKMLFESLPKLMQFCDENQESDYFKDEYCEISGVKLRKKCEHESDGQIYKQFGTRFNSEDCSIAWNSCKKCGEFYK